MVTADQLVATGDVADSENDVTWLWRDRGINITVSLATQSAVPGIGWTRLPWMPTSSRSPSSASRTAARASPR